MAGNPYTEPVFETAVEADVVYAKAIGYWSRTDITAHPQKMISRPLILRELDLMLDIYLPKGDPSASRPLLLMMHGGAFLIGNKNDTGQSAWCRHFASLGYVAVSIDYRMGFCLNRESVNRAEQDAVEDAVNALSYLLEREDLRIDPERIFVAGTSAGAAIALTLAFDPPGNMPPCRIRAVGDLWGYVHDLAVLENARIPVIAFQSEKDPVVPFKKGYPMRSWFSCMGVVFGTSEQSRKAEASGLRFDLYPCPEKGHRLHMDNKGELTPRFYEIRDKMTTFFSEALN